MLAGPRRTSSLPRSANFGSRSPPAVGVNHDPRTKNSAGLKRQREPQSHELPDKNSHEPSNAYNLLAAARARQGGGDPSIAEKKRKLLLKQDWTGVEIQKPLRRDSNSRRGKPLPWPPGRERAIPQESHVLGRKYDARMKSGRGRHGSSPALGDIRVRVGSQEARFAESSSMGHRHSHREPSDTSLDDDLTTSPYFQSSCKLLLRLVIVRSGSYKMQHVVRRQEAPESKRPQVHVQHPLDTFGKKDARHQDAQGGPAAAPRRCLRPFTMLSRGGRTGSSYLRLSTLYPTISIRRTAPWPRLA